MIYDDHLKNHHAECWREHHECAIKRVEEFEARNRKLACALTERNGEIDALQCEWRSSPKDKSPTEWHIERRESWN